MTTNPTPSTSPAESSITSLARHTPTALIFALVIAASLFSFEMIVHAANPFTSLKFPIAELGNCTDFNACKAYCDDAANADACTAFGQAHGLTQSADTSATDSSSSDNADTPVAVSNSLQQSAGPGGCTSAAACRTYCDNVTHIKECLAFGKAHGLLSAQQLQQGEKIAALVDQGVTFPGGCTTKDACEAYCSDGTHTDECAAFAKKTGLMGQSDFAKEQKFQKLITAGQTPGGCKSKDECQTYCSDASHRDECVAFAKAAGLIDNQQARKIQSLPQTGPGGCNSPEACSAYCNNSAHQDECVSFAEKNGLVPKNETAQVQQELRTISHGLMNAPAGVEDCVKNSAGSDTLALLNQGTAPTPEVVLKVKACFQASSNPMGDQYGQGSQNGPYPPRYGSSTPLGTYPPQGKIQGQGGPYPPTYQGSGNGPSDNNQGDNNQGDNQNNNSQYDTSGPVPPSNGPQQYQSGMNHDGTPMQDMHPPYPNGQPGNYQPSGQRYPSGQPGSYQPGPRYPGGQPPSQPQPPGSPTQTPPTGTPPQPPPSTGASVMTAILRFLGLSQ